MFKEYIKREVYVNKIRPFIGKDIIKVLVGHRRVGKSYLLYQIMDEVKNQDSKIEIVYINKELNDFADIVDHQSLLKYIDLKKNKNGGGKTALFIDEVQDIINFEKALRHLNASGQFDIYCTGSNAKLLSGELATFLSGRYIEVEVRGLSYNEFLEFHKLAKGKESLFRYIKYGGLPYLINLPPEDDAVYDYLRNIYNTIVLKDVVERFRLRNVNLLERLIEYLADNVGSLVSANNISDFLKSQKIKISPNTILNYLSYLAASYFIYKVPRLDIVGKKIFEVNDKFYFEDLGLRHVVVNYKQSDINKILENLVFSHLKYIGYEVKVGQLGQQEIDFVASRGEARVYVQVAYLLNSEAVKQREFGNLLKIDDNYKKIVVSMDDFGGGNVSGIEQWNVVDFLCDFLG